MLASEIIKDSCCGNGPDVNKPKLLKMVENLENENEILKDQVALLELQLNNAIAEIQKLNSTKVR